MNTTGDHRRLAVEMRGHDPIQVAISLANNRASKVAMLRASDDAHVREIGDRFQASLDADVEAFIAKRKCGPMCATMIREAAAGTWA